MMPEPLGKSVQTICFVDADHAGDRVLRHSCTGFLIFYCTRSRILSRRLYLDLSFVP
jgi:hypothetical protein